MELSVIATSGEHPARSQTSANSVQQETRSIRHLNSLGDPVSKAQIQQQLHQLSKRSYSYGGPKLLKKYKCMNLDQLIYERSTGALGGFAFQKYLTSRLLRVFEPAPFIRFRGDGHEEPNLRPNEQFSSWAHQPGVSALAVEKFDGKILISGGSEGSVRIWDLEQRDVSSDTHTYKPIKQARRDDGPPHQINSNSKGHHYGITHLAFHPWDSDTFLSSSFDGTLMVWATEHAKPYHTFRLGSMVSDHATSPIADQSVIVACASSGPAVRLVDLRTRAATQALVPPGQARGGVTSVAWSPRNENTLASGGSDGAVRIWDIRRGNGLLGLLDHEDSLGGIRRGGDPRGATFAQRGIRSTAKAHNGKVNALAWTDDGEYIVSAGRDHKIRVWSADSGANTLVNFGPTIRNGILTHAASTRHMIITPVGLSGHKGDLLIWPNETEVLILDLHEGTIVSRLRGLGSAAHIVRTEDGQFSRWNTVQSIAFRAGGGHAGSSGPVMGGKDSIGGLYTGHGDGQIRVWMPSKGGVDDVDEDVVPEQMEEKRDLKRKRLDDVVRSLTGREITFS